MKQDQLDLQVGPINLHILNQLDFLDLPSSVIRSLLVNISLLVHLAHSQEVSLDHACSSFHGVIHVEQSVQCQGSGCVPDLNLSRIC